MDTSFDSINRLMEFGMSMVVAQQMIETMNKAMGNMHIAGSGTPLMQVPLQYYVVVNGVQTGPFTEAEMQCLINENHITEESLMWKTGASAWIPAQSIPEINKLLILNKLTKK